VYGSGLPLGFLLLQSTTTGAKGGKQRFISEFLENIRTAWSLKPIITLSDKDWSEINALRIQFPDAKHQLCFWHVLRAIKTRLSILRRAPSKYDVDAAHSEFQWIDKDFVPISQASDPLVRCSC
jgi:MULE transposase domain